MSFGQKGAREDAKKAGPVGLSCGEDVAGEMRPGGFRTGGSSGIPELRRPPPWRLRGFAAFPLRVPCPCPAHKKGADVGAREGRGSVVPAGTGCSWETEPSAYALGYRLTALRAWCHGVGHGCVGRFRVAGGLRGEISTFVSLPRCGACRCFTPSGFDSVSHVNPGCASRPRID